MNFTEGSSVRSFPAGALEILDGEITGVTGARHRWPLLYLVNSPLRASGRYGSDVTRSYAWSIGDIGFKPPDRDWSCQPTPHHATLMVTTGDSFGAAVQEHVDMNALAFEFACIRDPVATHLFRVLREAAMSERDRLSEIAAETMGLALAVSVLRAMFPELGVRIDPGTNGLSADRRRRVLEYIEAHLAERMTVAELAAAANLSQWHFCRSFLRATGLPPARYITQRRVERAKDLMRGSPELPIVLVADACGFASQSHFTEAFRKVTGCTPAKFRAGLSVVAVAAGGLVHDAVDMLAVAALA